MAKQLSAIHWILFINLNFQQKKFFSINKFYCSAYFASAEKLMKVIKFVCAEKCDDLLFSTEIKATHKKFDSMKNDFDAIFQWHKLLFRQQLWTYILNLTPRQIGKWTAGKTELGSVDLCLRVCVRVYFIWFICIEW